jgi:lipase chaperone LimK
VGSIEALEERVKVQGMHIQQVKLEMMKEGMGDHDDLPNGQKFLQLRRLQQQNQPLEQLDEVIRGDHGADVEVSRYCQQGAAGQKERKQQQQRSGSSSSSRMEQMESSKDLFGTQEDSNSYRGSS